MVKTMTFAMAGLGVLAVIAAGASSPARAENFEYDVAIDAIEVHSMVTERMAAEAVLVALGIDRETNVDRLIRSRDQFDSSVQVFRNDAGEVGARLAGSPEMSDQIAETEELWQALDAAIAEFVVQEPMSESHIEAIAQLSESVRESVGGLATGLRQSAEAGTHSMLGNAIRSVAHSHVLSQQMTKEFLLIAYGYQPDRYRFALRSTAEEFELGLLGLIQGDFDQLLLPAPTPEIRTQLQRVEQLWRDEFRPLIYEAINRDDLDPVTVALLSEANRRLSREIESATGMYRDL